MAMDIKPSLLSFLVVLLFLLFAQSSNATNKIVEVNKICNTTIHPSFCSKILNSKPGGTNRADLITLVNYTIGVVRSNVTNTIRLIKSLIRNSTNSDAKDHYELCLKHFDYDEGALGEVEYAEKMLKAKDYQGVNVAASGVMATVDGCVFGDSPSDPVFPDHSLLPKYAEYVKQVADIICAICNYLTGIYK
ncbi:pectinesterase inhibitor 1-like [Arachis duranensis]|uniref:Pectinesterase inhibitor 1-like n=1 Tax=Arachis duranensis TaxID=130453 RepID=A0A6P4E0B0_ARADU|nr:pectinesterase inhibitor 1-like [Arachis duranensis]